MQKFIIFLVCIYFPLIHTSRAMLPNDDIRSYCALKFQEFNETLKIASDLYRDEEVRQETFAKRLSSTRSSAERIDIIKDNVDFEELFVKYSNIKDIDFYACRVASVINGNLDKDKVSYGEKVFISSFIANCILNKLFSQCLYDMCIRSAWDHNLSKKEFAMLQDEILLELRKEINEFGLNANNKLSQAIRAYIVTQKRVNDTKENIRETFSIHKEIQGLFVFSESYLAGDNITRAFYDCCLKTFKHKKSVSIESVFLILHSYNKILEVNRSIVETLIQYFSFSDDVSTMFPVIKFIALSNSKRMNIREAKKIYFKIADMYFNKDRIEVMNSLLSCMCDNPLCIFLLLKNYWEGNRNVISQNEFAFLKHIYEYGMAYFKKNKRYFDKLNNLSYENRRILQTNLFKKNNKIFDFEILGVFLSMTKLEQENLLISDFVSLRKVMNIFMLATLFSLESAIFDYFPSIDDNIDFWDDVANCYARQKKSFENTKSIIFNCIR